MSSATYTLGIFDGLLNHGWRRPLVLRDGHHNHHVHNEAELRAQVASSDYFAMLATNLDQISQNIHNGLTTDAPELEKLINDLLYLHQHYKIEKK